MGMLTITVRTKDSAYKNVSVFDDRTQYLPQKEMVQRLMSARNYSFSVKNDNMEFFTSLNTNDVVEWFFD